MTSPESRFRTLAVSTAALTYALILLGIYTAAEGAGLACEARWPLCDGWMGLFPANWPSFVEWFHRLVAMIAGFMILGTTLLAWTNGLSRRIKLATLAAVVLLPVQIWLGAETVLTYDSLSLIAHFSTALVIFSGLLVTAIWVAMPTVDSATLRNLLFGVATLHPVMFVLSPGAFVIHTPRVQIAYYAVGLLVFAGFLAAVLWLSALRSSGAGSGPAQLVTGVALLLVAAQLVLGRIYYTELVSTLDAVGAGVTFVLAFVAAVLVDRGIGSTTATSATGD